MQIDQELKRAKTISRTAAGHKMNIPLSRFFHTLEYLLPAPLIDTPAGERLSALTQSIPFALYPHSFGFETRLAEPEAAVDFTLCVDKSSRDFFAQMDDTGSGSRISIKACKLIRPIVVSPIVFSAFISLLYLKSQFIGFSVTYALLAFQIGFAWQQILEKKANDIA